MREVGVGTAGFNTGRVVMRDKAKTLLHRYNVRKIYLGERSLS